MFFSRQRAHCAKTNLSILYKQSLEFPLSAQPEICVNESGRKFTRVILWDGVPLEFKYTKRKKKRATAIYGTKFK